jgi:tetratricopeptide (TPR) repeat protein
LALTAVAGLAGAAPRWMRVASEGFEVYTSAGEQPARSVLSHLQQGRRVFRDFAPDGGGVPLPVRVYLFAAESEFRPYRPADSTGAVFQSGPVRDIIALPYLGRESLRVAMHEFVHLVLSHSAPKLPRWLEEGTAEFYSTLEVTGARVRVGGVIPAHLAALEFAGWLDAARLARVERDSPEYNETDRVGIFYAESWALTHMLNLAPDYSGRMPRFIQGLLDGRPPGQAFQAAFGRSMEAALTDLRRYTGQRRFRVVELDPGPHAEEAPVRVERIAAAGAERALGELAIGAGHLDLAQKLYRKLARAKTASAETEGKLGLLALKLDRQADARSHLHRAIELASRDAEIYFEYAMLLRDSGGDHAEVTENLRRAVTLNPNYAEAHFLLGTMASAEKRPLDALEHLTRAAEVLPRQSQFWHAVALAAHEAGDPLEARRAARRARDAAANPREIEMAEAALRLVEPPPPRPKNLLR